MENVKSENMFEHRPGIVTRFTRPANASLVRLRQAVASRLGEIGIKLRVAVIVATVIGTATILIGAGSVHQQEQELRKQTDVLGRTLVQDLADMAKDNLILNSIPIIQDNITNVIRRKIPGLAEMCVADRKGITVAHSSIDSVYGQAIPALWTTLRTAEGLLVSETETEFVYAEPIFLVRSGQNAIFLGYARVSFLKADVFSAMDGTKRTVAITGGFIIVGAIPIFFLLAGRFIKVGILLSEAARMARRSCMHDGSATSGGDVVGTLARELDMMVRQISEKLEIEKFVSSATVQMVSQGTPSLSNGSRKIVAALFTDIRNFTSVAEMMWPEEVVGLINQYLDLQTRVVHRHRGFVDKFIGDGIMCIFSGNEMAQDAAAAAIALQKEIALLNDERARRKQTILGVGVGIALGPVVLGSIGSRERMDYTAIGDTVNLASRLCGAARGDDILVSEDVVRRLDVGALCSSASLSQVSVPLKGRRNQTPVYQLHFSSLDGKATDR